jgi:hypothetical protein
MSTLGELVKEDVQLGTLYMFLVLMTPGLSTSTTTRVSTPFRSIIWRRKFWDNPGYSPGLNRFNTTYTVPKEMKDS